MNGTRIECEYEYDNNQDNIVFDDIPNNNASLLNLYPLLEIYK